MSNNAPPPDDPVANLPPELQEFVGDALQGVDVSGGQQSDVIGGYFGGDTAPVETAGPPQTLGFDVPIPFGEDIPAGTPIPNSPQAAPAREPYREGQEIEKLANMPTETRTRLVELMLNVGLISEAPIDILDEPMRLGFKRILAIANRNGERFTTTLSRIEEKQEELTKESMQFEPEPFIRPDYASLAQNVKSTFRQQLGREPDQHEMEQLTAELTGFHRLAYERDQELQRILFEQQQEEGVQGGGEVDVVDPMARFQQLFDDRYSGEIAFRAGKEETQRARQTVQQGVDVLDRGTG